MEKKPRFTIEACWSLLERQAPGASISIREAAEALGVSVRTLQRRLKARGLSYSDLVDRSRYERAIRMLRQPGAHVGDVARCLGYGNPSGFSRAFRRWSGISPKTYQLLTRGAGGPGPAGERRRADGLARNGQ